MSKDMINGLDVSTGKKMWIREIQKDVKSIPNFKNLCIQLDFQKQNMALWWKVSKE